MSKALKKRSTSKRGSETWRKDSPAFSYSPLNWIISIVVLIIGVWHAVGLRWISDDAFITTRYVQNFTAGKGLVYNVGERVEGYTHFLWLLLLSGARYLGFDPVDASIWLGIAAYTGLLILLLLISVQERGTSKRVWIPVVAVIVALSYDAAVWASGGLETSLYAFLILAAFYVWFYSKYKENVRLLIAGFILVLVALTRPDGVLFTLTACCLFFARGVRSRTLKSAAKEVLMILLPSVIIGVPYLLWKKYYYGDILPLTYYAKSAGYSYFEQGVYYIWLYFRVYFIQGLSLLIGVGILLRSQRRERSAEPERGSAVVVAGIASLVYLSIFVARTGGDFMFARFIIPVVPLMAFVLDEAIERLPNHLKRYQIVIVSMIIAGVLVENSLRDNVLFHFNEANQRIENWDLKGEGSTRGIADERWVYYYDHFYINGAYRGTMDIYSEIAKYLEPFFQGLSVTVAIPGAHNMSAYYANFATCINEYGLTDSEIAHSAIDTRGRIGHEKHATEDYLRKRHVDFVILDVVNKLPDPLSADIIAFEIPDLGLWETARLVTYNKSMMNELARRFTAAGNHTRLPLYEQIIAEYNKDYLATRALSELEDDYAGFQKFYFSSYSDTTLENPIKIRLAELKRDSIAHRPVS